MVLIVENKIKISQSRKDETLLRNDSPVISCLIIAAGLSSRMVKFKPLLDFNNKSFLSSIIDKTKSVSTNVIVVTGYNSHLIEQHIFDNYSIDDQNIKIIYNPDYKKGMFTSIKKGVENARKSEWIFFHQVDQPNLSKEFYHDFVNQIDTKYDWIQPMFKGQKGHPIIFGKKIIQKIDASNLESNLRIVGNSSDIIKKYWECHYPEILTDLDTPADYNKI